MNQPADDSLTSSKLMEELEQIPSQELQDKPATPDDEPAFVDCTTPCAKPIRTPVIEVEAKQDACPSQEAMDPTQESKQPVQLSPSLGPAHGE